MPTPLGIRRRVRRLLGLEVGAVTSQPRATVELTLVGPSGAEETALVEAGSTILAASGRLKRPIASGCSDATCGTCRVEVLSGSENLSPQADAERAALAANGHPAAYRQGCRAEILAGAVRARAFELV